MESYRLLGVVLGIMACVGCGSKGEKAPPATPPVAKEAAPAVEAKPAAKVEAPRRSADQMPTPVAIAADDWPQFRGAQRDGIAQGSGLARSWSPEGPPVVWETAVGQGYSAPSVVGDKVYLNDYDEEKSVWMVRCLALDSGDELWRYTVKKKIRPNHSITRSAPATDGGFVFAIDPKCELHCLDARDGSLIWKKFLPEEYDSQIPAWYNGQCPLIEKDRIVIATGGRAVMAALEKSTGEPIWETPNPAGHLLSHSSVMPVEIDGVKQYAYTTFDGLLGVDAESGKLLWHFPWKFNTAVSTSPLHLGNGQFLLTAGYHARTVACQVKHEGDQWTTAEISSQPPPTNGWNSEVHTPIHYGDYVYGVGKRRRGLWTRLDLEGNEVWTSDRKASFGMGGYTLADGMFYVLEGKTGTLRVLDADADEYKELASVKVLEGPDVWAPPVIAHGRLLMRDLGKLVCIDITDHSLGIEANAKTEKASDEGESQ